MKIQNAKVLVVDDEFGMREGMRRLIQIQGHQIDTAENGTEGIAKGTAFEYDLYFIDLKMPDRDGQDVLKAIIQKFPEAMCVIMTAYASYETAVETTQTGAYNYMPKPFTPDELQSLLDRALERRWYILENRRLLTEQEHRLLEVAHEKSRIRSIINAIDDGILVVNQEGQLVLFNPRFLTLLDLHQTVNIGESVNGLLPPVLTEQIQQILNRRASLKAIKQEIVVHPPDRLVVMSNTTPIINSDGQVLGAVSVLRDISELKKLEILKSQFVNMVAHELKAPLVAIQGYLDLVVNKILGDAPDTYDKYLKRSLQRSTALMEMIKDLLNISRMEAGTVRREIEKLDLAAVIQETSEFFETEATNQSIRIIRRLTPNLFVEADKEELQRIFNNLISNAIKYNKPNGEIHITSLQDGCYVKISVRDTGIGMQPQEKERLFEEFYRAKNTLTRNITGTGLGLSIVKKILHHYAGKIEVESEYEKGTTFTIYLPAAQD
ncbi:ATP-binding protein [candidate division KSB1 bacterium]|nr:ATP-binding protein [candidate division KSB1 bacterium]